MWTAPTRNALALLLAAGVAFLGSGTVVKASGVLPGGSADAAPGPLVVAVAGLLAMAGGLLLALAAGELVAHWHRSRRR
jgi:hypothetical protein